MQTATFSPDIKAERSETVKVYLRVLGWSDRQLSKRLGVTHTMVYKWHVAPGYAFPPEIIEWLWNLALAVEALPPPDAWR